MNEKEISEIRRRYRPDKNNITHVHGCYVNENREIVSAFHQPLSLLPPDETEKLMALLRRTLSGTVDKNLLGVTFSTQQVMESEEHKLLMALRSSALNDEAAVMTFFQKVIQALTMEGQYLILLAHDTYDVSFRSKDGDAQEDASSEVFSYLLCSVCPVKMTKPALSFSVNDNAFHNCKIDWIVAPPELGFLFPAFDDRSANIYDALYYSRSAEDSHQDFVDAVFGCELPMPAAVQKETFQAVLAEALAEDCSYEVVQTVHEQLCERIEEHKANQEEEPLTVTKHMVRDVLESCGVSETHVAAFGEQFDAAFGEDAALSPKNIVDAKQFQVHTPDVSIRVNPERSDLVQTRIINGTKYVLVRVEEGVEVNGVDIHITE